MNRLRTYVTSSLIPFAAAILPLAALTGCAIGTASFPDSSPVPEHAPLGSISGSNFGGHAPLVGAHVYVLQPSTSGYGTRASSILTGSVANGATYPTAVQNSTDPDIPTTWYYQKTDLTGAFNITNDYTCTVGLPVYLYLYGGSPTYPSANNTFDIATITWSGSASPYTVTMTLNTSGPNKQPIENAYIGEFMTMNSTFTSAGGTPLEGSDQVVIAGSGSTALSTTQFSFSYNGALPSGVTTGTTYTETGSGQVTFDPTFNPGVVNLAMLGNCPSDGFTGANAIKYVYVNEVSTVATAYVFRPFELTPSSTTSGNNATYIGTSSTNIAGIQNAATIAKQLYDITGSQLSTTYAGEGHIANKTTVAGNGLVPQANIDTIANILAACVDSNNGATTVNTSGSYQPSGAYTGISAQCNTLFSNATSTGIPIPSTNSNYSAGTQPLDTAQAALNLARHPGGPIYNYSSTGSTTFIQNLFTLPTGNRPFTPDLASLGVTYSQLNDFEIAIDYLPGSSYNGNYVNQAETLAIDKIGNVWVAANNNGNPYYFYELSPAGVISNVNSQTSWQYGTVIIDSNESAWAGAAISNNPVTYVKATNTPSASSGVAPVTYTYSAGATNSLTNTYYSYAAVADSLGNVYFGNAGTTGSANSSPLDYIARFSASSPSSAGIQTASITGINNYNNISFLNGSLQPYSGSNATNVSSAFFEYNAYINGQVQIDSIPLSSSTASLLTAGGTPTHDTGFPVYGIYTSGSGNAGNPQTQTTNCSILNSGKLTTTAHGNAIVPDFHNGSGGLNNTNSSLYFINRGTGTSGACTKLDASTLQAGLNSGWASTLDGNNYVYIVNRSGANSMSVISVGTGATEPSSAITAVSPSTAFYPQYWNGSAITNMLTNPFYIAVGPSGEIWIPNNDTSGGLVEIIGLAAPETTPFSVASSPTNNGIGAKP